MRDTMTIEIFNGETIRIEPTGAAKLFRDGAMVACAHFSTVAAARLWADAIIERAAKSSPRAVCLKEGLIYPRP